MKQRCDMENCTRNSSRRNINQRNRKKKRKRLIRRIILFIYRLICLGIIAIGILLAGKLYESITVSENLEGYPESLIALMERNPEAEDFVLNYLENKDKKVEIDLSKEVEQGEIPLFLQWDERWGYELYGDDFLAVTGCGPTCLSMVRCGLSGDATWNPLKVADMANEQGYYVDGVGSSWNLMTEGAAGLGLTANAVIYDESHIFAELEAGNPIICAMRPGDFTTSGHFIVLVGVDAEGNLRVCDPNSRKNSEKSWSMEEVMPQIKNLWSYSYSG